MDALPQWMQPGNWFSADVAQALLLDWAGRVLAALVIFLAGRWVVLQTIRWLTRAADRAGIDATLTAFLGNLASATLLVFVILTSLSVLGVPTTNFLAVLGAAGLAVGLALKDSLANFSAGIMLVIFRPFRVGDAIDAGGITGTVEEIRIFSTLLRTPDNREITVPNGLIFGSPITNFSARDTRRIDLVIGISYGDSIPAARDILQQILAAEARILADPPAQILVLELGPSSVDFAVRPWVRTEDYWATRSDLLEQIKTRLEAAGITIPFPQQDVHLHTQGSPPP